MVEEPAWLTKEYIRKALEDGKDFSVKIEDMKITKPVPVGNNYTTDIYGIKVEYRRSDDLDKLRENSLILKAPIVGPLYDMQCKIGMIQKEAVVYNEYLPKLKTILAQNDSKDEEVDQETGGINEYVFAESYYSTEKDVVILEDLKVKSYRMVDRVKQLDCKHCVVALKTLSKLHAGSVVLYEKEPELVKKVGKEVLFCEEFLPIYSQILKGSFSVLEKILKNHPKLNKYLSWFEKTQDKLLGIVADEVRAKENELNVLNHGDYWLTNMLFKYDSNNKPIEVIPIDLQACRFGSPALDFIYFLEGSVQENVRDEHFDDLIAIYVEELNSNLEKYGSAKRLEQSEFKVAISTRPYIRYLITATFLPMVIADPNEVKLVDVKEDFKSFEDFFTVGNNPFEKYFTSKRFLKILSKRMEEFDKNGLLTANC